MKTLKSSFNIEGKGLMGGIDAVLEVVPGKEKGIRFNVGGAKIKAALENVVSTEHCVVLAAEAETASSGVSLAGGLLTKIALVEHFMAACAICGIDALDVHFKSQGFEMPILDGSAKGWVEKFSQAGFDGESEAVEPLKQPLFFEKGKSHIIFLPSDEPTNIIYSVNYDHPDFTNRWADSSDMSEVIEARTFGFLRDLEMLQKAGYSKGVTIDNTVGLTDDGGYTTKLRNKFEPVKHKILDFIGDLYLTGINPLNMRAKIIVKEAGHALHIEAAKMLKDTIESELKESK